MENTALTAKSPAQQALPAELDFLLCCVREKILREIASSLKKLSFNTYRTYKADRSAINGAINWPKTMQARIASGFTDSTLFITAENYKDIDTTGNRIIKFLLAKIATISQVLLQQPGSGQEERTRPDWYAPILALNEEASQLLQNPRFSGVTLPRYITAGDTKKLLYNKKALYRKVALLCQTYRTLLAAHK